MGWDGMAVVEICLAGWFSFCFYITSLFYACSRAWREAEGRGENENNLPFFLLNILTFSVLFAFCYFILRFVLVSNDLD